MKKIIFGIICLLSLIMIPKAISEDFFWHNDAKYAYTSEYSGMIQGNTKGTYQNGTIVSKGDYNIELKNFKAIDIMMYRAYTLTLKGVSVVDFIEQSTDSTITLAGTGTLKVKEVGLSMENMINKSTLDYKNRVQKYVQGNYTLSVEGDYLVFTAKPEEKTTTNKEENKNNSCNTCNTCSTQTTSNNDQKEENDLKQLSFSDSTNGITINGNDQIEKDITFSAIDTTEKTKEKITSLTEEKIYKIYDFSFKKNNETVNLEKNIEVSITVEEGKEYNIYYYNGSKLLKLVSSLNKDQLTFETNHFSEYVITIKDDKQSSSNEKNKEKTENKAVYIAIGITAIAIIGIIGVILLKKKNKKQNKKKSKKTNKK